MGQHTAYRHFFFLLCYVSVSAPGFILGCHNNVTIYSPHLHKISLSLLFIVLFLGLLEEEKKQ